jgi:hypothetical protein
MNLTNGSFCSLRGFCVPQPSYEPTFVIYKLQFKLCPPDCGEIEVLKLEAKGTRLLITVSVSVQIQAANLIDTYRDFVI